MICEFCKKEFKTKQLMKHHQESAKYCIKIQKEKNPSLFKKEDDEEFIHFKNEFELFKKEFEQFKIISEQTIKEKNDEINHYKQIINSINLLIK